MSEPFHYFAVGNPFWFVVLVVVVLCRHRIMVKITRGLVKLEVS